MNSKTSNNVSNDCFFCDKKNFNEKSLLWENDSFYARWDDFPVSKWHTEIIAKKHIESFFDLTNDELINFFNLLKQAKKIIQKKYSPDAFNIGINEWYAAWRTIHHLHIHIIPRYTGDVVNPRGWIRHIIPGKGNY